MSERDFLEYILINMGRSNLKVDGTTSGIKATDYIREEKAD